MKSIPALLFTLLAVVVAAGGLAHANTIPLGGATNYAVLYERAGGHDLNLSGTRPDQVLFNFQKSGQNIDVNNNGETAFQGRFFGDDSSDVRIVSGDTLHVPRVPTPEPATLTMLGTGLIVLGCLARRRQNNGGKTITLG